MKIEIFKSFKAAEKTWKEFQEDSDLYIFQTFEWQKNRHVNSENKHGCTPCLVSVRSEQSSPIVFFPFEIKEKGILKILTWFGDSFIDYGTPIIPKTAITNKTLTDEKFDKIWFEVLNQIPPVDFIWLKKIPEYTGDRRNPLCELKCDRYQSKAHFTRLSGDWKEFYKQHAGSKTRSTNRRKLNNLKKMGTLSLKITDGSNKTLFTEISEAMVEQKVKNYRSMSVQNFLSSTYNKQFFTKPVKELLESSMLHISCLYLDDKIITTHWGMIYKNRFYYYMPSFENDEWAKFSPGNQLLFELFKWCFHNDIQTFDFTVGDENYKEKWCDLNLNLFQYFEPCTFKGNIAGILYWIYNLVISNSFLLETAKLIRKLYYKLKYSWGN